MPTYITLVNWTEQGITNVKETLDRDAQVGSLAQQLGGQLTTTYWTQGPYDLIVVFEFPDDETFAAFALALGSRGAVRTESLRAYSREEMQRILQKLP
jgi:uncharacterized protein with GYD domain